MKTFFEFFRESKDDIVVMTFGRFNPPTIGHLKLVNAMKKEASKKRGKIHIYASQSHDPAKNPLKFSTKIKWMREIFKMKNEILDDMSVKHVFDILVKEYNSGTRHLTMVVGSDRVKAFDGMVNKYNGVEAKHGYYKFEGGVDVVSAGERDPDQDGAAGMSASKMRAAAMDNDIEKFTQGLPNHVNADELMQEVRDGMGL
jgi:phosphopantetheine adenylyltransferase